MRAQAFESLAQDAPWQALDVRYVHLLRRNDSK